MSGRKKPKEGIKDAIWDLQRAEGDIRGLGGFEDICQEIIVLREKIKDKFYEKYPERKRGRKTKSES